MAHHSASVWEDLARASVPRLRTAGGGWGAASRWWGAGLGSQAARGGRCGGERGR